ncbi:unnamed protein product [Clonostachys rhizophaga]|uniref:Uncharacterized protein n=1 Tax=Clonostachys rhizophaga TaxID=160324 RepID=A0A9N9VCE8_9HYPO|nr:unnamed protein product [Clonostachys rhizophaga]
MAQSCSCAHPTLFIGLDIGVTYSGAVGILVEYCIEHKKFNVLGDIVIDKFQTLLTRKGKTEATFLPPGETIGPDDEILSYFKMGVIDLNGAKFSQADDKMVQGLKDCWGKQPTYVVAPKAFSLFIHGLYQHVIDLSEERLEDAGYKYIAQAFFTEGAYDVKNMVIEEEHVAALRGLMQSEPDTIQSLTDAKETAIICDIGGMTTDVVVHRFCPIGGASALPRVCMSRLNGACLIDEEYSKLLDREIERQIPEWYRENNADAMKDFKHLFMSQWREKDKLKYDPANYGDSLDLKIGKWRLSIQHAAFIGLFDPLLEHVISVVKEAYNKERAMPVKPPTKVILVGGLSHCKYLVNALTEQLAKEKLEVYPSPSQTRWNIVALGASYHYQL